MLAQKVPELTAVSTFRRLFTTDEYYQMLQVGILSPDDHVELIQGEIIKMAAMGSPHAGCINRLHRLLNKLLDDVVVAVQTPVHVNDFSEPEPDVALLRFRDDFYTHSHPQPEDVLLIIEVAETSLEYDRKVKLPMYAAANIPEVWIVNLSGKVIEVHRQPTADGYEEILKIRRDKTLSPLAFPQLVFTATNIVGP